MDINETFVRISNAAIHDIVQKVAGERCTRQLLIQVRIRRL
jgi:hypothetical protein